jgi:hypothetical protein
MLFRFILLVLLFCGFAFADDSHRTRLFHELYADEGDAPALFFPFAKSPVFSALRLESDLKIIQNASNGLFSLLDRMPALLLTPGPLYTPEEEDEIHAAWVEFLNYRSLLLRVMGRYIGYGSIEDSDKQKKAVLLSFGCAVILYHAVGELVQITNQNHKARRKLNEGDPAWGLQHKVLFALQRHIGRRSTKLALERAYVDYVKLYLDSVYTREEAWLKKRIDEGYTFFKEKAPGFWRSKFRVIAQIVKDFFYRPYYGILATVSSFLGDFRYRHTKPMVSEAQVDQVLASLKPGDILLERQSFFLSNSFLPGFWPHAVFYLGTPSELRKLGVWNDPRVQNFMMTLEGQGDAQTQHIFMEAIAEGVVLASKKVRLKADYMAVLRPRLPLAIKQHAIIRAFTHLGKPYDFTFDLFSSDKIICSELIYRSYGSHLSFDFSKVLGRYTLPPSNIARRFARTRGSAEQQFDFVHYLEGEHKSGKASFKGVERFIKVSTDPEQEPEVQALYQTWHSGNPALEPWP